MSLVCALLKVCLTVLPGPPWMLMEQPFMVKESSESSDSRYKLLGSSIMSPEPQPRLGTREWL